MGEDDTDTTHLYYYTDADMDVALQLMAEGLRKEGYRDIGRASFEARGKEIFGSPDGPACGRKDHPSFVALFPAVNAAVRDEVDYTSENLFVPKQYNFITNLPLLNDFATLGERDEATVSLIKRFVARNKYLFNSHRQSLAYLKREDKDFILSLVRNFGYDVDTSLNAFALQEFRSEDDEKKAEIGKFILVISACGDKGRLQVRKGLLHHRKEYQRQQQHAGHGP